MAWMSSAKADDLLTAAQLNPEILTDDAAFVTDTIQRAARWLCDAIGVDRYPDMSQGESVSGASPSEDISALSTNELLVSIDDDDYYTISLTLGSLTSGAAIAAEIQTQIRAVGVESYKFATCVYTDHGVNSCYAITSPTYGESSNANVSYDAEREHVAQALKLSTFFGGEENMGSDKLLEFDDMVIRLVNHWYNTVGAEGMASFSVPGSGAFTSYEVEPHVKSFIMNNRRVIQ